MFMFSGCSIPLPLQVALSSMKLTDVKAGHVTEKMSQHFHNMTTFYGKTKKLLSNPSGIE